MSGRPDVGEGAECSAMFTWFSSTEIHILRKHPRRECKTPGQNRAANSLPAAENSPFPAVILWHLFHIWSPRCRRGRRMQCHIHLVLHNRGTHFKETPQTRVQNVWSELSYKFAAHRRKFPISRCFLSVYYILYLTVVTCQSHSRNIKLFLFIN